MNISSRDYAIYTFCGVLVILAVGIFISLAKKSQPADNVASFLATTDAANIYSQLTPQEQTNIKQLVFAYCSFRYHRDSCLHHYITCGEACKPMISPKTLARMKRDYKLLVRYRSPASNK